MPSIIANIHERLVHRMLRVGNSKYLNANKFEFHKNAKGFIFPVAH